MVECWSPKPTVVVRFHAPLLNQLKVMELTILDFEKMAQIAVVIKDASDKIQAITGEKPDLRLFDSPPEKPLINHDDFVTRVMQMVASEFDITIQELKSRSRKKPLPDARGVAMIAIHQFTSLSLKKIGLHFGGRDHSTVITRINETFSLAENELYLSNIIEKTLDQCKLLSMYVKPETNTGADENQPRALKAS